MAMPSKMTHHACWPCSHHDRRRLLGIDRGQQIIFAAVVVLEDGDQLEIAGDRGELCPAPAPRLDLSSEEGRSRCRKAVIAATRVLPIDQETSIASTVQQETLLRE
jgi:hypothetical protein